MLLDVTRVHRSGTFSPDVQNRILDIFRQDKRQRLEPLDNLMHVFEHPLHGLMLVHDAVEPEAPDSAPRSEESSSRRSELPSV